MAGCGYKMFLRYSRNVRGLQLKKRPGGEFTRALPVSRRWNSVDVVLLPVEGGVGLDDDVFVGVLLEFVRGHGLAGLRALAISGCTRSVRFGPSWSAALALLRASDWLS